MFVSSEARARRSKLERLLRLSLLTSQKRDLPDGRRQVFDGHRWVDLDSMTDDRIVALLPADVASTMEPLRARVVS